MRWFKSRYTESLEERVKELRATQDLIAAKAEERFAELKQQIADRDKTIASLRVRPQPQPDIANTDKPAELEAPPPKLTSWVRTLPELENATEIKYPEN